MIMRLAVNLTIVMIVLIAGNNYRNQLFYFALTTLIAKRTA